MWRNWQTHWIQNPAGNHVGSSPTIGTNDVFVRTKLNRQYKYHSEKDGIFLLLKNVILFLVSVKLVKVHYLTKPLSYDGMSSTGESFS